MCNKTSIHLGPFVCLNFRQTVSKDKDKNSTTLRYARVNVFIIIIIKTEYTLEKRYLYLDVKSLELATTF